MENILKNVLFPKGPRNSEHIFRILMFELPDHAKETILHLSLSEDQYTPVKDENIKDIKIFNNAKQNEFSDDDFSVVYQELRSEETPMTEMEMIEEPMPEQGSFLDMETS